MKLGMLKMLIVAVLLSVGQLGFAQKGIEKVKAKKVDFISRKVDLTPDEAKVFWPVYHEMDDKLEAIQLRKLKLLREGKEGKDTKDEAQLKKAAMDYLDADVEEAQLRKSYFNRFAEVIPVEKIVLLYRTEQQFKVQLLEEIKQRRQLRKGLD